MNINKNILLNENQNSEYLADKNSEENKILLEHSNDINFQNQKTLFINNSTIQSNPYSTSIKIQNNFLIQDCFHKNFKLLSNYLLLIF